MSQPVEILKISYLNPLRFHKQTEKFACELIPAHERKVGYIQKFHATDTLMFQVLLYKTKWDEMSYNVFDNHGYEVLHKTGHLAGSYGAAYDCWSTKVDDNIISSLTPGTYYIQLNPILEGAVHVPFLSEPFEVVEAGHENPDSILIEYSHDGNEFDMAFFPAGELGTRQFYQLRVEGGVSSDGFIPSSKDSFYIDQIHNVIMLESVPYNVFKFTFGSATGIPNWLIDKINRILSCSYVEFNGRQFAKNDGAKLEPIREKGFPFAGWQVDMTLVNSPFSITEGVATQLGDYNIDYNEDYF